MLFSDCIPNRVQEHPTTMSFASVLDALQNFKREITAEAFRVNNCGILMDRKWLLKKLEEFGVSNLPIDYPIQIIRQYLLNVDTVCRTRGSKKGIELYCSLLSFGEVTINDSEFFEAPKLLLLDSLVQGFVVAGTTDNTFYLCDNTEILTQTLVLKITIKSRYFNGDYPAEALLIKNYLESTIGSQLGFSSGRNIVFEYQPREEFYFHELLNPYFV